MRGRLTARRAGVLLALLAAATWRPVLGQEIEVPAPPPPPAADMEMLELELEKAREELDKAAEKLAELNMRIYESDAKGERSNRPMLGVLIPEGKLKDGIKLIGVTPKGGAAEAGLEAGDRLLAVNGYRLDSGDDAVRALHEAMHSVTAGDTVAVEYERDGVMQMAEITTQARGAYVIKMDISKDLAALKELESLKELAALKELEALKDLEVELEGIDELAKLEVLGALADRVQLHRGDLLELRAVDGDLAGYFGVEAGVVAMAVPEGCDLKAGDVLLSVDGVEVEDVATVVETLVDAGDPVSAVVLRDGAQATVSIAAGTMAFAAPGSVPGKRVKTIRIEADEDGAKRGDERG